MDLTGKTLCFLGDSITAGHGVSDPDNRYHQQAARLLGMKEAKVYGVNGSRIAPQHHPTEDQMVLKTLNFCARAAELDRDADGVVVFGGTNDWGHGDAPMGTMDDRTTETFYGACHTLFGTLAAEFAGKPVVILTPLHRWRATEPPLTVRPDGEFLLLDYVRAIRQVAEYYALPVCDLYATSGLQPEIEVIRQRFVLDGLHPNDEGHALIARRLAAFLTAL